MKWWPGKDLEVELDRAYAQQSRYILVLVSDEYSQKMWPSFERAVWSKRVADFSVIPVFIDDIIIKEISTSICRVDFQAWRQFQANKLDEADYQRHFDIMKQRIQKVLDER